MATAESRRRGLGAIGALAGVVVLVPGLVVYALLRAVGLEIGPAGLVGLLVMIIGVVVYPVLLRRLGWVDPPAPPEDAEDDGVFGPDGSGGRA